jgi:hypothetical protein
MPSKVDLRPVEIAILVIVRAAPATGGQLADFFPELARAQLDRVLDGLCQRRMLMRDAFGLCWATDLGVHVLRTRCVSVWISTESEDRWPLC